MSPTCVGLAAAIGTGLLWGGIGVVTSSVTRRGMSFPGYMASSFILTMVGAWLLFPRWSASGGDDGNDRPGRGRKAAPTTAVEQTLDVGEDDEEVGVHEGGDEGAEAVVVAELDFFDGDGVVLVNDRDHAIGEELEEGVAGVEVALPAAEVVVGEEDLGDVQVVLAEQAVVGGHEFALR